MEKYAKLFTKAGLIYLLLGAALGISIGSFPEWSVRLRFVHIHFNLLGFMTMMIAGVAYHVLPRFNARPVPWPDGVKYHFILQNVGLLGMCGVHMAGGMWKEGVPHILFVGFAVITGAGLAIMFYNLYFVLKPPAEDESAPITGDMKVAQVLDRHPAALQVFLDHGFSSLANPVARKTFAHAVSVETACKKHEVAPEEFLKKLNAALATPPGRPPAGGPPPSVASAQPQDPSPTGTDIQKGEPCQLEVRVGSLIKVYPETKGVFEKHYGEGCFSCPGQVFETVEQTAQMHNVDPQLILEEINARIADVLKGS